jgi:hypothetical protein
MNTNDQFRIATVLSSICAAAIFAAGCATTDQQAEAGRPLGGAAGHVPSNYKADDNRSISIGNSTAAGGGWSFKEPHLEKCWIADGFNFSGYDTLYIAPTVSTAKFHDDEATPHDLAKQNLPVELKRSLAAKGIFVNVVTSESEIKPGARTLRLENTITEYSKGGGAARYFVGLYGGGQPVLRVQGKMADGEKVVFNFEARRSGVSAGARMTGAFMKDEDIQIQDIRSMTLDLTDFIAAIAGKYQPEK